MMEELDEFHAHEVLDRLHLICSMVDDFLLSHPYVTQNVEIEAAIIDAEANLTRAYQMVGEKTLG